MKLIKIVVALMLLTSHTINAVWWNPCTWFSCCDETEAHDHHHCSHCNH